MTSLAHLLDELSARGISLDTSGEKLNVRAPVGSLDDPLRRALRAHKAELLELLRDDRPAAIPKAPRDQPLPLSFAQQRLWFLDQLDSTKISYNIPTALRMRGRLDVAVMKRVLTQMIQRHEVLRTRFPAPEGTPHQEILASIDLPLEVHDLRALGAEDAQREGLRLLERVARQVFELDRGPLFRVLVAHLSDEHHLVGFTMHHIISDGWSMRVLIAELTAAYLALEGGAQASLPPLRVQYADYCAWQRAQLGGAKLEAKLDYWRETLAGASAALELPWDHPRPSVRSHAGALYRTRIEPAKTERLRRLGQRHDATLFMVLIAAYAVLLHRLSGQVELTIGTPIAGRGRPELAGLIGFFANSLPLRFALGDDPSFENLLARTRRQVLALHDHEDVPFERIVEALEPERSLSHSPLFQTMASVQTAPMAEISLPSMSVEPLETHSRTTKFDLTLLMEEAGGGVDIPWEYSTELFDEASIVRMARHFELLLDGLLDAPEARASAIELLTDEERERQLWTWNQTEAEVPEGSLGELFLARAESHGTTAALEIGGTVIDYRTLARGAMRVASRLRAAGVGTGEPVGILSERGAELIFGILGIVCAGACYVPLDPSYPKARIELMLRDSGARWVLTGAGQGELGAGARGLAMVAAELLASGPSESPTRPSWTPATPEDPVYLMYTSGSTGTPKGVLVPHRAVVRLVHAQGYLPFGPQQRFAQLSNASFDAFTLELWGAVLHGGCLVGVPGGVALDPHRLADFLRDHGITAGFLTSSLFNQIVRIRPSAFGAMDTLMVGGEALDPSSIRAVLASDAPPRRLVNGYGPTECTTFALTHLIDELDPRASSVPIGRPIANTRVYVLDERSRPVPIGVVGELHLGGPGLALGYHQRPELDTERFIAHPFIAGERLYRTGDLARLDERGLVHFVGRRDDQHKIRGYRVELGEIEAALSGLPEVEQAAVLARRTSAGHLQLVAYVAPAELEQATLRAQLAHTLPAYMNPARWLAMSSLPLTPNGKVDRAALAELALDAQAPEQSGAASLSTPRQRVLAEIWSAILDRDDIGPHDSFFELGGDSIQSIQMVAHAERAGLRIRAAQIYQHQTLAALAAVAEAIERVVVDQGPVRGTLPLTPIQRWLFERELPDPAHFNQSLLLELPADVDHERLARAIERLVVHHDALRLRFVTDAGAVTASYAELVHGELELVELAKLDPATLEAEGARVQASLDLAHGPLLRAVLFHTTDEPSARLLLVIHHLVVDGVSWRILVEDLVVAYEDPERPLPHKTHSYKTWAERLVSWAEKGAEAHRDSWQEMAARSVSPLPNAERSGAQRGAGSWSSLVPTERLAGLQELPQRLYGVGVRELLASALLLTLTSWSRQRSVRVALEGHGRELPPELEDLDISRTVGWFTSITPVVLELPAASEEPSDLILAVKEQLYALPDGGLSYGALRYLSDDEAGRERLAQEPEVALNYLGRIGVRRGRGLLSLATEPHGPDHAPGTPPSHPLVVEARLVDAGLELTWVYNLTRFEPALVERLCAEHGEHLAELVRHCAQATRVRYSPADFPDCPLGADELDALVDDMEAKGLAPCTPEARALRAIFPLTAAQQGMLIESLGTLEPGLHVEQLAWDTEGTIDLPSFERAWAEVVTRHDILRTAFDWRHCEQPVQFTLRSVPLPLEHRDLRGAPEAARAAALDELLAAERLRGFDLDHPPLMRLLLVSTTDTRATLVWTFHHVLLDGWSLPIIAREVFEIYTALLDGRAAELAPARPYRDFVSWLGAQDEDPARRYWSERLGGLSLPTALGSRAASPKPVTPGVAELVYELDEADTTAFRELCAREGVTPSTAVLGAWALCSSCYAGERTVVFGATVSGRPATLAGVEGMVGLFVNTIPVRIDVADTGEVWPWLREVQATRALDGAHEHHGAGRIHEWLELSGSAGLFESIVVYENYPGATLASGGLDVTMKVPEVRSRGAQTRLPLTILVIPDASLKLRFVHRLERLERAQAERIAADLRATLRALARGEVELAQLCARLTRTAPPIINPPLERRARRGGAMTELQRELAALWSKLLEVPEVGPELDFFAAGGHSLLVLLLLREIREQFGVELQLAAVFEDPTLVGLAEQIERAQAGTLERKPLPRHLVLLRAGGPRPPLFLAPPGAGSPVCYLDMARALSPTQPVYGFESPGLVDAHERLSTVEDMAARLVECVRELQPRGPYSIAGWSFGAMLAWEAAGQLREQGQDIDALILVDAGPEDPRRARRGLGSHLRGLRSLKDIAAWAGLPRSWEQVTMLAQLMGVKLPDSPRELTLSTATAAHHSVATWWANVQASPRYVPRRYDGPITLIRAAEAATSPDPLQRSLRSLTAGEVRVVSAPGNHMTMMLNHAHATRLGELLQTVLTRPRERE